MNLHSAALYVNVCTYAWSKQGRRDLHICVETKRRTCICLIIERKKRGFDLLQPEPLRAY
jgi:hypothetical protein